MEEQASRIVVGYDGSEPAGIALQWAAAEADRRQASLCVTCVFGVRISAGSPGSPRLSARFEREAAKIVAEGARRARKVSASIEISTECLRSGVASGLVQSCAGAALLVLGHRGLGEAFGVFLRSVAYAVTARAPCPVVIVRGDCASPGPRRPVVVGIDGSAASEAAARYAAESAMNSGARLIVVVAYRTVMPVLRADTPAAHIYRDSVRTAAEQAAAGAVRSIQKQYPHLIVEDQVLEGPTRSVLCDVARSAGEMVLGSRGHGGFTGMILGSVSHAAVHDAPCPVIVVPETSDRDPSDWDPSDWGPVGPVDPGPRDAFSGGSDVPRAGHVI